MKIDEDTKVKLTRELAQRLADEDHRQNARRDTRDQGPLGPREAAKVCIDFIEERL